jgi:hypothetical protein
MKHRLVTSFIASVLALASTAASGMEYHVSVSGNDANTGKQDAPLRTIQRAADLARPGDIITVHEGIYRERVSPPRGGASDSKRIVYRAAEGAKVVIKGSEVMKGWEKVQHDTWKATVPNTLFGKFNPYNTPIQGDWLDTKGRPHHVGAVYLNGEWRWEAVNQEEVLKPAGANPLWFGKVEQDHTTLWAQFPGVDPNEHLVEINVRETVFYPEKPGCDYITVRGFTLTQAATPWAPPTAEQPGLIGTHWSKGWIIENNEISYSRCVGVTLGKYGDEWDNAWSKNQNNPEWMEKEAKAGTGGYVATTERALKNGWSKEKIGSHQVRNNKIHHCEQAGIVGSLGGVFSSITGNEIHNTHVQRQFSGAEMAAIKLHAPIDVLIANNYIHHCNQGIWLDWMAQGTRVTRNLLHDNPDRDLFVEVNHGPFLVDHNIMLSPTSILSCSRGGAYAHNLMAGGIAEWIDKRETPYMEPHSTKLAGLHHNHLKGDDRYYNNIFVKAMDMGPYNTTELPMAMGGNVYLAGAKPCTQEKNPLVQDGFDPEIKLVRKDDGVYLQGKFDPGWTEAQTRTLVTTQLLGKAKIPDATFEQPDGSPFRLDTDYFGKKVDETKPFPGPFAAVGNGAFEFKVW